MAFFVLYYGYIQQASGEPVQHAVTAFEAYATLADAESSLKKTAETAERLGLEVPDVIIMEADSVAEAIKRVAATSAPPQTP